MTASIMAYIGSASPVVGMNGAAMLPWWTNNQMYNLVEGAGATAGARQFTGYVSGDETLVRTRAAVGVNNIFSNNGGGQMITPRGRIVCIGDFGNSSQIVELRAADLSLIGTFGAASGSTSASDGTRILAPFSMAPLSQGGSEYAVIASAAPFGGEICVLSLPALTNIRVGIVDEAIASVGRGNASTGTVFALGKSTYSIPNTTPIGLYVVQPNSLVKKGTVSPVQVDATWTNFSGASGVAYDQTDGNPIIQVKTNDAVANQIYFVKLNAATAAVIWKTPVNTFDAYGDQNMGRHNIVNQKLYFLGSGNTLYTINTSTGATTSAVINTLTILGPQISEDVNNSLIALCGWNEGSPVPTYVGTYMGTLGNHGPIGSAWFRYFPGSATAPLPLPPVPFGNASVSINRAWAFVVDGHWFYVLDLGAEGTYLFDKSTRKWSHWYTQGFVNWDIANGTMWGQRIVGGDLATTDVWEVSPTQLKDNGSLNITHVVTGLVSTRSRDFTSCDVVRVAASLGLLDDVTGATFNLRFSDDNGQTFGPTYSVTLVQGNYHDEVAFRSLGSFNSPGRVFELSDTGGLIRIDGCDMNPEDKTEQDNSGGA